MPSYSLTMKNNSTVTRSMLVFQKMPDLTVPDVVTLAWLATPVSPGSRITHNWDHDYYFVWGEQGALAAGASFKTGQSMEAHPAGSGGAPNHVTFDLRDGAHQFVNAKTTGTPGRLTISTGDQVAPGVASIGIGMSGAGTFVVPAIPKDHVMFTPHPEYWVAFGEFVPGQVLDITKISNAQQIEFGPELYAKSAVYSADGTWTVA